MNTPARCLVSAQLAFWSFVAVCFALTGGGLGDNHGFSVYGGRLGTIIPWALGFAAAAALIARAATLLEREGNGERRLLAQALRVLIVLLLLVLFTPDTVDQVFYVAHIVASVLLFLFQAVLGLWLVVRLRASARLYAVEIAGGIVAGLSQAQWIGLLSPGILAFQVAFGVLLVNAAVEAETVPEPA